MNENILSWIDLLPDVSTTDFPFSRDMISLLLAEADSLSRKASELSSRAGDLRHKAYLASCMLEGEIRGCWSNDDIEDAKRRCNQGRKGLAGAS
ncbi:stable inheritance protein KleA [Hahella ganghwensis]|uniref:stable inheritance protein KleA n=1 Tax=Hahella ganghwensis TaxID=286420 RepID=UPI00037D111F|nr:stable inheritance protein KleA [Hahella ganghwensis]